MLQSIGCFFVFVYFIYRFGVFQLHPFAPWVSVVAFLTKVLAGVFVWAIYTFYYTDKQNSDIYKYFSDAQTIHQLVDTKPNAYVDLMVKGSTDDKEVMASLHHWERNFDQAPINENRLIIRLNVLLFWVSGGAYFVHVLMFCFIAYWASICFFNTLFGTVKNGVALLGLCTIFFPSILLWSSGVLKEPLLLLGLAFLVRGLLSDGKRIGRLVFMLLGVGFLLCTKFVVLVAVLPAGCAYWLAKRLSTVRSVAFVYSLVYLFLLAVAFLLPAISTSYDWPKIVASKQANAIKEATYFKAGSAIALSPIEPSALGVFSAVPQSIFTVLFRPFVWEAKSVLMLVNAIENILLLLLLLFCVWRWRKPTVAMVNVVFFLLVAAVVYFAVVGIVTPVLGNLVRYKTHLLPFVIAAIVLLSKGIDEKYVPKSMFR